jgi:hypothetical protein
MDAAGTTLCRFSVINQRNTSDLGNLVSRISGRRTAASHVSARDLTPSLGAQLLESSEPQVNGRTPV